VTFLKFSRDKRGYEHFYLVHQTIRRGGPRNRVLYWFRTPPGVKVGRAPFDEDVRRALEKQNPNVTFDWRKLLDTPIPPPAPDVERWRPPPPTGDRGTCCGTGRTQAARRRGCPRGARPGSAR
jgi:hypothetical protein